MSDFLTEFASAAGAAAPYASAIEAIGNGVKAASELGVDLVSLFDPSQNYDEAHQARCTRAANLVSDLVQNPGPSSVAAFTAFLRGMLAADGRPVAGGIPTVLLTIGVDDLLALISGTSEGLEYRELFAQLATAGRTQPGQPGTQQVSGGAK